MSLAFVCVCIEHRGLRGMDMEEVACKKGACPLALAQGSAADADVTTSGPWFTPTKFASRPYPVAVISLVCLCCVIVQCFREPAQ
jgi:hypothetical protein